MRAAHASILLVMGMVVAGCVGNQPGADPTHATSETSGAYTYQVQGVVLSDEELPVANATVGLDGGPNRTTNLIGEFLLTLKSAQPESSVLVWARADGFAPATQRVHFDEGTRMEILLTLTSVAKGGSVVPYVARPAPQEGYFACGAGFGPAYNQDSCFFEEGRSNSGTLSFAPGLTTMETVLSWDDSGQFSSKAFELTWPANSFWLENCGAYGSTPVYASCTFTTNPADNPFFENGANRTWRIKPYQGTPASADTAPTEWFEGASGVFLSQRFTVEFTLHYWGHQPETNP